MQIKFDPGLANRAAGLILLPQERIRIFDPDRLDIATEVIRKKIKFDSERANKAAGLLINQDEE